jgi:hypothetical protein
MTFDNSRRIISTRLVLFAATFPFLAFLALTYVAGVLKFPLLGMSETAWVVILSALYFGIAAYPSVLRYNYIYFSDDGSKIIIRFYSAGIFKGLRQSVEIPKKSFAGFRREKKLGIIPSVSLLERRAGVTARYPSISLSALNRRERERIYKTLAQYAGNR